MALQQDTNKTIKPRFNFSISPPNETWTEPIHENYSPESGDLPERVNALDKDKFNEIERVINQITEYLGDVTFDTNNTVGQQIRYIEGLKASELSTQLFYVLSLLGIGAMAGNANSSNTTTSLTNGRFEIDTSTSTANTLKIKSGSALSGLTTSNTSSVIALNETEITITDAPEYIVGTTNNDPDPTTWSTNGEQHDGLTADSEFYLDHRFLVTASTPFDTASNLATLVAVKVGASGTSAEARDGTFEVDVTTGRVKDLGFFTANPGNYYFYYRYYGWRFDTIYLNRPTDDSAATVEVSEGTAVSDAKDLVTASLPSIVPSYSDIYHIPLYFVVVAPNNNTDETQTLTASKYVDAIINDGYSASLSLDSNIIDARRMLSLAGSWRKQTNGQKRRYPGIIALDKMLDYLTVSGSTPSLTYSRRLLITPESYIINDNIVRPETQIIQLDAVSDGYYNVSSIDISNPDGYITVTSGTPVSSMSNMEEPSVNSTDSYYRAANIIVDSSGIANIIPGTPAYDYKAPIQGIAEIPAGSTSYTVTHNIGHDYISYAIPIEQPDGSAPFGHFVMDNNSGSATKFMFDNNGSSLKFLYCIIPTHGLDQKVDATTGNHTFTHGGFKNSRTIHVLEGTSITGIASSIGNIAITKAQDTDTINIPGTGTTGIQVHSAVILDDYIGTHDSLDVSSTNEGVVPGTFHLMRWVGVVTQFLYAVSNYYWLDMQPATGLVELKLSANQPASSDVDIIVLR